MSRQLMQLKKWGVIYLANFENLKHYDMLNG